MASGTRRTTIRNYAHNFITKDPVVWRVAMSNQDRPTLNMSLKQGQKDRWEAYQEEHSAEHPNMSQFIRTCVEREIAGNGGNGGVDDELREAVHDVVDGIRRVESRVDDVDDRLEGVEASLSEPPEDVQELMTEVFDVLPKEGKVNNTQSDVLDGDEVIAPDGNVMSGRVEDIADHLDTKTYRVRRAIEQLQEDSSLVEQTEDERFYRRA